MISEVNIPNLLRLIKHNERAPGFDLASWLGGRTWWGKIPPWDCGTYGCLVGNDVIAQRRVAEFRKSSRDKSKFLESEYGLSSRTSYFLFSQYKPQRFRGGLVLSPVWTWPPSSPSMEKRDCKDRAAALARVRKFVYYVLHKREMLYVDAPGTALHGTIREEARKREGDWNVAQRVLEEVGA